MIKKNEPKKFIAKKEDAKPKEKDTIKINGKEVDVYKAAEPKRVVENIDSERIELAKSIIFVLATIFKAYKFKLFTYRQ